MYFKKDLLLVKKDIENYIGSEITVKSSKGRQRATTHKGVITNAYPNIFTVKVDDTEFGKDMAFSYADILTNSVIITLKENKD